MDEPSRETRINTAFVTVADTLTTDFDVVDLLHTLVEQCTEILDTDAGGMMLMNSSGQLQLMTSTSDSADFVEGMQLNSNSGPCIDCLPLEPRSPFQTFKAPAENGPRFKRRPCKTDSTRPMRPR
jgi:hypothetical protein